MCRCRACGGLSRLSGRRAGGWYHCSPVMGLLVCHAMCGRTGVPPACGRTDVPPVCGCAVCGGLSRCGGIIVEAFCVDRDRRGGIRPGTRGPTLGPKTSGAGAMEPQWVPLPRILRSAVFKSVVVSFVLRPPGSSLCVFVSARLERDFLVASAGGVRMRVVRTCAMTLF